MTIETNDWLQQVEDYVSGHTWQLKLMIAFHRLKIMSEVTHDNWN